MKERAFHFRGPASVVDAMVRATLSGTKTQFRMPVKFNEKIIGLGNIEQWARKLAGNDCYGRTITEQDIQKKVEQLTGRIHTVIIENGSMVSLPPPYGKPGDRLWVREAWTEYVHFDDLDGEIFELGQDIFYRADQGYDEQKWRPSIHMPRWASRITLDITSVRVEHLQDISIADCIAEGIPRGCPANPDGIERREYCTLWKQINGPDSWNANPWVWVVEFKRVQP